MSISNSNHNNKTNTNKAFPIVAIGASAGGVEAIKELFQNLSATTGMGFIYIQHLDPNYPSRLTEIIARETQMPVVEGHNLVPVEPDHIYIIPPNSLMAIKDGILNISPRKNDRSIPMPIDFFFSSLAEHHKEASIGVILSGTGTDGTLGLKAIKAAGGITFAQDGTAQFNGMPQSAISEGVVDKPLPIVEIAAELEQLSKKSDVILQVLQESSETIILDEDEDLYAVLQLLKKSSGVDFTHYKTNTIKRRIIRRMLLYKKDNLTEYLAYLKEHPPEITDLYKDLLINVTSFFRDPDTLEFLKKTLLQRLINSKGRNEPMRIWIPACSTGEEAYSLAMIIIELIGDKAAPPPVQIFATDLSEMTITKARLGIYTRNDVAEISPARLQRFFNKTDGSYRIIKEIRDLCVFATHNIFRDPPFSRIDLLSCCNLMIYIDAVFQKKILSTFHYALNPDGILVLGKSETIGTSTHLFSQKEKKFKVYIKKHLVNRQGGFDPNYRFPEIEKKEHSFPGKSLIVKTDRFNELEHLVDSILLHKYIPASVVVNEELEILQFRGPTGLYLEPAPGKASLNLMKMAKPGLAFELRNTIYKSSKAGTPVKKNGLEVALNDKKQIISIEVVPLNSDVDEKLFLVVFEHIKDFEFTDIKSSVSKDKLVKQLQEELKTIKEDMRSIIEEQEASNEELQSANEEIVSSNEELQSINEELETSKEEMESTNEELLTINAELQIRNEQLAESYEYAEAVFSISREAIIVLDKDLRIKSANASFYNIFHLHEPDTEGMLIFELENGSWDIPDIRDLLLRQVHNQKPGHNIKIRCNFPASGPKILLVNACNLKQKRHNQEIMLLAIEDITNLKENILNEPKKES